MSPKNLPPLWSGKFSKQKLCRYLQACYIVYKMVWVWASDLLLQLPGIDTKKIKSDLLKQKCPKTPQNHSPLEWVWVSRCSAGTRFSSGHCRKTFITWKKNTIQLPRWVRVWIYESIMTTKGHLKANPLSTSWWFLVSTKWESSVEHLQLETTT